MSSNSMLSQLQGSYQRLEQSLQRLTDSIAAYNPSTTAADELVAANDDLNASLDMLIEHQRNVLRIEQLQRVTQANDEKIKDHYRAVAELRKELNIIPSTDTTTSTRDVSVDELLQYARYISRTTIPPTFGKREITLPRLKQEPPEPHITNGIATPPNNAQDDTNPSNTNTNVGAKSLPEGEKAYLASLANLSFEPWPSLAIIGSGALANIQYMVEQGQDPANVLSPEEQVEADRRRAEEVEREKIEEEERVRRRQELFDTAGGRRRTVGDDVEVFNPDD